MADYFEINPLSNISWQLLSKDSQRYQQLSEKSRWLTTTFPDLSQVGSNGMAALTQFADFEIRRRATIIILALEAYRLDNGKLPESLDELVGDYLDRLPLDPITGTDFHYQHPYGSFLRAELTGTGLPAFAIPDAKQ